MFTLTICLLVTDENIGLIVIIVVIIYNSYLHTPKFEYGL